MKVELVDKVVTSFSYSTATILEAFFLFFSNSSVFSFDQFVQQNHWGDKTSTSGSGTAYHIPDQIGFTHVW